MATPKCPYFGKCGGCSSQHIDYSLQLDNKKKMMERAAGVGAGSKLEVEVFSGNEYGYRNRMDFIFHHNGLGFRKQGNWRDIIDVKRCEISDDNLNNLLTEVREAFRGCDNFDVNKKTGTFRYAVIRTPQNDSSISFVLNADSSRLAEAHEKIKEFALKTTAKNIIVTSIPKDTDTSVSSDFFVVKGKDMLSEEYCGKKFLYSVQGFFQNNHAMAEKMIGYARELLRTFKTKEAELLDLYGGVGAFGIVNADLFKKVHIVESVKECIDAAKKNADLNGIKNTEATVLDARYIKKLVLGDKLYVITDPPRSGMHPDTISALNRLKPAAIIYVSCNIEQLGKDIPKFKDYHVTHAALFDLFPQTPHCEGVVMMGRR